MFVHTKKAATLIALALAAANQAHAETAIEGQSRTETSSVGIEMYSATQELPGATYTAYPLTTVVQDPALQNLSPHATTATRTLSRYNLRAPEYQIDPLKALLSINYGSDTYTVRDAVRKVADFIGYRLLEAGPAVCPKLQTLLSSPLPTVHRHFEGVPVREVLRSLAGPGYFLVVDRSLRKLTFDTAPADCAPASGRDVVVEHEHTGYVRTKEPVTTVLRGRRVNDDPFVPVIGPDDPAQEQTASTLTPTNRTDAVILRGTLVEAPEPVALDPDAPVHPKSPLKTDAEMEAEPTIGEPLTDGQGNPVEDGAKHHEVGTGDSYPRVINEWRFGDYDYVRETLVSETRPTTTTDSEALED